MQLRRNDRGTKASNYTNIKGLAASCALEHTLPRSMALGGLLCGRRMGIIYEYPIKTGHADTRPNPRNYLYYSCSIFA
jgi:hypothetical protein